MRTDTLPQSQSSSSNDASAQFDAAKVALDRSKDDVARDLRALIEQGQALLSGTGALTSARVDEVMQNLRAKLAVARERAVDLTDTAKERSREYARTADDYVHANPWQVIAGAGVTGIVIGLLCSSRR
jgi:ElaB/YqjD/DUF883 family membrane-anchored ribosome-binding protein